MAERILNLGSGSDVAPDEIGVDLLPLPNVGVVCNLDAYPLPFRTDSIDRVAPPTASSTSRTWSA